MKRAWMVLLLIAMITMPVSAHSGGTDASGGHWNRSTGEYHYHHGYPAHDHTDMDGDGVKDCPYEFKNKEKNYVGDSRKTTPKATTAVTSPSKATTTPPTTSPKEAKTQEHSSSGIFDRTFSIIALYGFACALVSCVAFFTSYGDDGSGKLMILSAIMWIIFAIVRRIFL